MSSCEEVEAPSQPSTALTHPQPDQTAAEIKQARAEMQRFLEHYEVRGQCQGKMLKPCFPATPDIA